MQEFLQAIKNGDPKKVETLIDNPEVKENINTPDDDGNTVPRNHILSISKLNRSLLISISGT